MGDVTPVSSRMRAYTFLCIASTGAIPTLDVRPCRSDRSALNLAAFLFKDHQSCVEVEVWQEERWIGKRTRSDRAGSDWKFMTQESRTT
jgi:hypothetical protein